jgi:hypothetical protein
VLVAEKPIEIGARHERRPDSLEHAEHTDERAGSEQQALAAAHRVDLHPA